MAQSKTLAGVFAFFLGLFGVHRFYVNRDRSGALYVVLTAVLALPVVLHHAGWFYDAFGPGEALKWPALAAIIMLVLLLFVTWVEAFRFWAMHPRKFDLLYTKPIVPAAPASGLRERAREDPDGPDDPDAPDEWEEA